MSKTTRAQSILININSQDALIKNNGTYNSDVLFKFSKTET